MKVPKTSASHANVATSATRLSRTCEPPFTLDVTFGHERATNYERLAMPGLGPARLTECSPKEDAVMDGCSKSGPERTARALG